MKMNVMNIRTAIKVSFVAVSMTCFQACVDPISRDELPDFVQKIVVNVVSSNIEGSAVEVSLTASPYDSTDFPQIVEDAIVQFKVNGSPKAFSYNPQTSKYENPSVYQPGDQLQLTVSLQNKSTVSAVATLPAKLESLRSTLTVDGGIDATGNPGDLLTLTFNDAPESNYYRLKVFYYSESAGLFLPFDLTTNDAILNSPQTMKTNDGSYLFSDETFNGRERSFAVVAPGGITATNPDEKYLIELHSMSRDYFVYLKTLQDFRDAQDNTGGSTTLGSAVVVHSNIAGGLGIFGVTTAASDTLR